MLTLICGVSRAGKTTFSKQFDDVIHLDEYGTILERYENVNKIVSEREDAIVEGVYDHVPLRLALLEAYKGEKRICIFLNPTEEEIKSRPWAKRHGYRMPPFEPPTYSEGWDEIIVIGDEHDEGRNYKE